VKQQQGSALLMLLLVLGVAGAYLVLHSLRDLRSEREQRTTQALAQAKEALLGFAASYADSHAGQANGYLPLPDLGSSRNNTIVSAEGMAAANFAGNATGLTVLGRLPWRTLGLGPLRDGSGECLWYAISGNFQDVRKHSPLNWDTPGQFEPQAAHATPGGLSPTLPVHQRAAAIVFTPGATLAGQLRAASGLDAVSECGGNYAARNYLDPLHPSASSQPLANYLEGVNDASASYTLDAPKVLIAGPVADAQGQALVNDRLLGITPDELFRAIQRRASFKAGIDRLLDDLSHCLNALDPADPGLRASQGNKGVDHILAACPPDTPVKTEVLRNWRDNLLYTRPGAASSVNGVAGCGAVLLFGGARTQRSVVPLGAQIRASAAQTGSAGLFGDPAMYLEGGNTRFPAAGAYAGAVNFDPAAASADLVRCIQGGTP
jgi:hypothetical protein